MWWRRREPGCHHSAAASSTTDFLPRRNIRRYFLALIVVAAGDGFGNAFLSCDLAGERHADVRTHVWLMCLVKPGFRSDAHREALSRLTPIRRYPKLVSGRRRLRCAPVLAIGSIVMMAVTSPKLTSLCLIGVPLFVIPIIVFGRRVRKLSRDSQDRIADTAAYAGEALNAIATVQAFTHEDADRIGFARAVEDSFAAAIGRTKMRAAMTALVIFLVGSGIVGVLWIGASDVLAGVMTGGTLSQFILYAVFLATGMGAVSETWGDVQRAAGATERLMEILSTEPAIKAPDQPVTLGARKRDRPLQQCNLLLSLATRAQGFGRRVLRRSPRRGVSPCGAVGCGQIDRVPIVAALFRSARGTILFDGVNIADLDPRELRRQIALVAQDPAIFSGTIFDNIRYGRPEASDADVYRAAEAAAADEFIRRLPGDYGARLGERGVTLSGGQRQRVAIARAILRNAPLLLLDEATSALDAENERLVQQGLANLMSGRTTIVIAHRLATIQRLRRIAVMDQAA